MPTFIKTLCFNSTGKFNSEKDDDDDVNAALEKLQGQGASILDVKVGLGGYFWGGFAATFLIVYDAEAPIATSS